MAVCVPILSAFEHTSLEQVSGLAAGWKDDKSGHSHGTGTGEASQA